MSSQFDIQADLKIKGPPNLNPLINQLKAQLAKVNTNVKIGISTQSARNVTALNTKLTELAKNLSAVSRAGTSATQVLHRLDSIFASLSGHARVFNTSIMQLNKGVAIAQTRFHTLGELIGLSARRFVTFSAATLAIGGFSLAVTNAIKEAVEFQHSMVKLVQVGGDSQSTIRGVSKEITRLSTEMGTSSADLAKVSITLRQAGLSALATKQAMEALAKTSLSPTFDSIEKTTEGAIAIMAQFKVSATGLENALSKVSRVSADYAVESSDLIEAVKRAGGAFRTAGGSLDEFLALITSVRATTRESAETIATGFKTIFARLERPDTLSSLRAIGVELTNLKGQFIGPYESVKRLSQALKDISPKDVRYAQIVELVGGIRQFSKVIPLIQETALREAALNTALNAQGALAKDAATAQGSLIVKVTKLKEEFLDLFRVISNNSTIQGFVSLSLTLATSLVRITKALEPLIPLLMTLAAVKIGSSLGAIQGFGQSIKKGFTSFRGFASGGTVVASDTVPAMLTPGEFVLNKKAAQTIGYGNLNKVNKMRGYAEGGKIGFSSKSLMPELQDLLEKGGFGGINFKKYIDKFIYATDIAKLATKTPGFTGDKSAIMGLHFPKARTIALNAHAPLNEVSQVLAHELTHAADFSKQYNEYRSNVPGHSFNKLANMAKSAGIKLPKGYTNDIGNMHEYLAYGASSYFENKKGNLKNVGPKLKEFFDAFENDFIGKLQQVTPLVKKSGKDAQQAVAGLGMTQGGKKLPPLPPSMTGYTPPSGRSNISSTTSFETAIPPSPPIPVAKKVRPIDLSRAKIQGSVIKGSSQFQYGFGDQISRMTTAANNPQILLSQLGSEIPPEFEGPLPPQVTMNREAEYSYVNGKWVKQRRIRPYGFQQTRGESFRNRIGAYRSRISNSFSRNFPGLGGQLKRFGGAFGGNGAIAASVALPYLSEQVFGNAEKPGFAGTGGAQFGSVVSSAVAGGTVGAMAGPWGALAGAVIGAAGALMTFKKDLETIKVDKLNSNFIGALGGIDPKTGKSFGGTGTAFAITADELAKRRNEIFQEHTGPSLSDAFGFSHLGMSPEERARTKTAAANAQVKAELGGSIDKGVAKFKELAQANPTKNFDELKKMLQGSNKVLALLNQTTPEAYTSLKEWIKALNNSTDKQNEVDLSFTKLSISADEMSQKITQSTETLGQRLSRNAIGRGGISGGVDFMGIQSLGPEGQQLHNFARFGGGIDQARNLLKDAMLTTSKNGVLGEEGFSTHMTNALKGPLFEGPIGGFLRASVINKLSDQGGEKLIAKFKGDPIAVLKELTEDFEKVRPMYEKSQADMAKAMQMFAQDAVSIADSESNFLAGVAKRNQFGSDIVHNNAMTLMANNDSHFFNRNGELIDPQDQIAHLNMRHAENNFAISQSAFGIHPNISSNPDALAAGYRNARANLENIKAQANTNRMNGGRKDFSLEIASATKEVNDFQNALKNLGSSTTVLEAAQQKLQIAIDKEAADREGRRSTAQTLAFGSREDIMKMMMSENLIGTAVQQGHLENFTDQERAMTLQRLQETGGVVRQFGRQKVTSNDLINMLSGNFMPGTNMAGKMVRTPNGRRFVTNGVLAGQNDVNGIANTMMKASDLNLEIERRNIQEQTNEHMKEFDTVLKELVDSLKELQNKTIHKASGGMARGTDTVPAMLTPGEFIVNRHAAQKNMGVLHAINSGMTYMAAGGDMSAFPLTPSSLRKGYIPLADARTEYWRQVYDKHRQEQLQKGNIAQADFIHQETQKLILGSTGSVPVVSQIEQVKGAPRQMQLKEIAHRERAHEIEKRVERRKALGLPEFVPINRRQAAPMTNAFNDVQANQIFHSNLQKRNNFENRMAAAQGLVNNGIGLFKQGPGGGNGNPMQQFVEANRPLVEALNGFPKEIIIKRDGNIQVILNGAEVINKMKGDLEKEVWNKIIETIQKEVPKALKKIPG